MGLSRTYTFIPGNKIRSIEVETELNNIINYINNCVLKDGSVKMTKPLVLEGLTDSSTGVGVIIEGTELGGRKWRIIEKIHETYGSIIALELYEVDEWVSILSVTKDKNFVLDTDKISIGNYTMTIDDNGNFELKYNENSIVDGTEGNMTLNIIDNFKLKSSSNLLTLSEDENNNLGMKIQIDEDNSSLLAEAGVYGDTYNFTIFPTGIVFQENGSFYGDVITTNNLKLNLVATVSFIKSDIPPGTHLISLHTLTGDIQSNLYKYLIQVENLSISSFTTVYVIPVVMYSITETNIKNTVVGIMITNTSSGSSIVSGTLKIYTW